MLGKSKSWVKVRVGVRRVKARDGLVKTPHHTPINAGDGKRETFIGLGLA